MIESIEIGYIRSFEEVQGLSLALPDKTRGSGYNLIVGKNNAGKSTVVKALRDLISNQNVLTVGVEARHDPKRPHLAVRWKAGDETKILSFAPTDTGGLFAKTGPYLEAEPLFRYVPSRRPFQAEFSSLSGMSPIDYERNDFYNRRSNVGYFDSQFAVSLAPFLTDPGKSAAFFALLQRLDPRISRLDADNVGNRDVIRFESASGRWHTVTDTGDGIVNSIRTIFTLMTSDPGSTIVIDEPELSLHPQLQRNLHDILLDFSCERQLIVVTHSPHFIEWDTLSRTGGLFRIMLDRSGYSQVKSCRRDSLLAISKVAHRNVMSRRYYDAVCKELFFSDEAVLVEGAEDVNYISNYLESSKLKPLPLVGYGAGGAETIRAWMRLCLELGIRCVAIYDADKKAEFDATLAEFAGSASDATAFLLGREDIRDKYKRDQHGKETNDVIKNGVFRRDGTIHKDAQQQFELLIESVRTFLAVAQELNPGQAT